MRLRFIFARALRRFKQARFSIFWGRWVCETITAIQAETLNRIGRGYLGRKEAATIRMIHVSITRAQSRSRQWLARRIIDNIQVRRLWAAVEIQRNIRGFFGRIRMGWRIEEYVAKERMELRKDREFWEHSKAACLIQRSYRRCVAVSVKVPERRRLLRESSVLNEFIANAKQEEVEKLKYMRAFEHYFLSERKKLKVYKLEEKFITEEKVKLRNRQWVRTLQQWSESRRYRAECEAMRIEDKLSFCSSYWHSKILSHLQIFQDDLQQSFTCPKSNPKAYKMLEAEAHEHLKHIFYEAEHIYGQQIERGEAFQVALHRAIVERKAAEAVRLEVAMRANQARMLDTLTRELELENEIKQEVATSRAINAAVVIQGLARKTSAQVQLRSIARDLFFREFDEYQVIFTYVNKRSLEIYETRPRALGPWNLKPVDQFIEMSDPSGNQFFFNPCSGLMQYKQPSSSSGYYTESTHQLPRIQSQLCSSSCCHDECEHFCNACCLLLRQLLQQGAR